jgi:NADPH-dependent 2,4-dienoyl-CoA reductase/sulfur reductase-like enzyme
MKQRQLVVIGGGPGGLAAAAAAKQAGVRDVLLIERNRHLGGILNQCIHPGFGLEILGQNLTGPEYAQVYVDLISQAGVECWTDTMVTSLNSQNELIVCGPGGLHQIQAQAVVLSMGCRERTRGAISLAGTRPAGVYTAGVVQHLINLQNRMIGRKAVILGSGDIGLIMARRLSLEGAEVLAVVEKLPYPGGLPRNIAQCLEDFDIPLYLSHTVVEVHGYKRVSGVTIARVGPRGGIVRGSRRRIDCDTLLLSVGLIPENELTREAGIALDEATGGPRVDNVGQTSQSGVFACGNTVYVHDIVDQVTREAQAVGQAAANYLVSGESRDTHISVRAGQGIRCLIPQQVQHGEQVSLNLRVTFPARDKYILIQDGERVIYRKLFPRVNPPEMIRINLNLEKDRHYKELAVYLE